MKLNISQSGSLISVLKQRMVSLIVVFPLIAISQFKPQWQKKTTSTTIVEYRQYFQICDGMMFKFQSD